MNTDPRVDAYIDALPEWQQAICRYRAELTREVAHDHLDSLITTCMLLGMHSFYMPNQDGVR